MLQWLACGGGYGSAGEQPERHRKPGDRAEIKTVSALSLPCYQQKSVKLIRLVW